MLDTKQFAAMCDTGLEWCGFKMFLLIPQSEGYMAGEVLEEFRASMKTRNFTMADFYRTQSIVLKRIIEGRSLVN